MAYYDEAVPGLGLEFLDELEHALHRILLHPEAWTPLSQEHRRCRLRRFPYGVIYSVKEDSVLVADRIKIKGRRSLDGRFECEIPLENIQLPKATLCVPDAFRQGTYGLPFVLALLVLAGYGPALYSYSTAFFWTAVVACLVAIVTAYFMAKRTKYYQYSTEAGVPVFDVGAIGRTEEELEQFASLVDRQVEESRKANQSVQRPPHPL